MSNKDFLQEKFIELNQLKSLLISYPKDYSENVIEVMERVCNSIELYLEENKQSGSNKIGKVQREFTLRELSRYNGQNGMPGYIAVNGDVYDVYDSLKWSGGVHFGVTCGTDETESFANCHKDSSDILCMIRKVGVLKKS